MNDACGNERRAQVDAELLNFGDLRQESHKMQWCHVRLAFQPDRQRRTSAGKGTDKRRHQLRGRRPARTPAPRVRQQRAVRMSLQQFANGSSAEQSDFAIDNRFQIVEVIEFRALFGFFRFGGKVVRKPAGTKPSTDHTNDAQQSEQRRGDIQ